MRPGGREHLFWLALAKPTPAGTRSIGSMKAL
jgi:hypothetical protein